MSFPLLIVACSPSYLIILKVVCSPCPPPPSNNYHGGQHYYLQLHVRGKRPRHAVGIDHVGVESLRLQEGQVLQAIRESFNLMVMVIGNCDCPIGQSLGGQFHSRFGASVMLLLLRKYVAGGVVLRSNRRAFVLCHVMAMSLSYPSASKTAATGGARVPISKKSQTRPMRLHVIRKHQRRQTTIHTPPHL